MSRHRRLIRAGVIAGGLLLTIGSSAATAQDPLDNAPMAPQSAGRGNEGSAVASDANVKTDVSARSKAKPEFIHKTAAQWRGILSKYQYAVTREKATEPPYTGKYASGHFKGTFVCVCCDAAHVQSELFSAQTKFESGTGWPSFYQAYSGKAVQTAWDASGGEPRLEVMCRRCGAHLGHVFEDGPPPTGLRFCVNSAAIKLVSAEGERATTTSASEAGLKSKARVRPKTGTKSSPRQPRVDEMKKSNKTTDSDKAAGGPQSPSS